MQLVARSIRSPTHVDVGSDHGLLLRSLLDSGRVQRGIAIENKQRPFENSVLALRGYAADIRFGDGLAKLQPFEADSLSVCGIGGRAIVRILSAFPDRVPSCVVVQPNRHPEAVREWGLQARFQIVEEHLVWNRWQHNIICFRKATLVDDPAYDGVEREAAIMLGPLIIKSLNPHLIAKLRFERECLRKHAKRCEVGDRRLMAIESVMSLHSDE